MSEKRKTRTSERRVRQWPEPTVPQPSFETIMDWAFVNSGCEATDGCWVEPDGICPHGHPSWQIVLEVI